MFAVHSLPHKTPLRLTCAVPCRTRCRVGNLFGQVEGESVEEEERELGGGVDQGRFVGVNRKLVGIAEGVFQELKGKGRVGGVEWCLKSEQMVSDYEVVLQECDVNLVNCVTMLHRLGMLFGLLSRDDDAFHRAEDLLKQLIYLLAKFSHELDARQISNVVWALGKIGRKALFIRRREYSAPELYSLLFERTLRLDDFKPWEISSFLVGLANIKFKPETCQKTIEHLTALAADQIYLLKPRELANIIWSLGTLEYAPSNTFLTQANYQILLQLDDFPPQQTCNVLWGLAKLEQTSLLTPILPDLETSFGQKMRNYSDHGISLVLWSFAKFHYLPRDEILDKAVELLSRNLPEVSCQSITNSVYAFAIFGYSPSPTFLANLKEHFTQHKRRFSSQLICMFIWSLAMIFQLDQNTFTEAIHEIDRRKWKSEFSKSEIRQVYQCLIHLQVFYNQGDKITSKVSPDLLQQCSEDWKTGQDSKWTDSTSLSVLMMLQKMGYIVEHKTMVSLGSSHLFLDTFHPADQSRQIVLEVTIPKHTFNNDRSKIEGPRQWMLRLLQKQGFQIFQVDAYEWRNLNKNERYNYLQNRLKVLKQF